MSELHLKPGEYTVEVLIHFEANQNNVSIPLPSFEHLRAVYLTDYQVVNPLQIGVPDGGGGFVFVNPLVMRLSLGSLQPTTHASNVGGTGFPVIINGTTRVSYERPRLVSDKPRQRLNQLNCQLSACVSGFAAPLDHSGASFSLVFVCHSGKWDPSQVMADTLADPHSAAAPFSTHRRWQ
jgi:hypothetical protein